MICPRCHSEFVTGVVECPDCGVSLVEPSSVEDGPREAPARGWAWLWVAAAALLVVLVILWMVPQGGERSCWVGFALTALIYGGLLYGVGRMAVAFNRSAALGVILGVVFAPITAAVFLFVVGGAPEPPQSPPST